MSTSKIAEKIDQVVVAINFLDSVVRLPENINGDISTAGRIIEKREIAVSPPSFSGPMSYN